MRSSAGPRSLLAAGILVCICLLSRAPGAECTAPLEDRTLQELTLYLPKSALPGQTVGFTLGTWECCVFIVPVPACAGWTLEPPEAGTVTLLSEPPHPFGRSGQLELSPSLPHGTVVTLTADVESGRRVLSAALHVYTPEANPLVGYWTEKSQLTCPGFIRGELDRNGKLEITDAVGVFGFLFLGDPEPGCLEAADSNGDDRLDLTDGIYVLEYLFLDGPPPPAPFPSCEAPPVPSPLGCREAFESCPGLEIEADPAIGELVFEADGTFSVTWFPFEVYRDYWGTYSFDLKTGSISVKPTGGNYVPPDVRGEGGSFRAAGDALRLERIWLGSPLEGPIRERCGHVFERY